MIRETPKSGDRGKNSSASRGSEHLQRKTRSEPSYMVDAPSKSRPQERSLTPDSQQAPSPCNPYAEQRSGAYMQCPSRQESQTRCLPKRCSKEPEKTAYRNSSTIEYDGKIAGRVMIELWLVIRFINLTQPAKYLLSLSRRKLNLNVRESHIVPKRK